MHEVNAQVYRTADRPEVELPTPLGPKLRDREAVSLFSFAKCSGSVECPLRR
jgi:hypothetical protein